MSIGECVRKREREWVRDQKLEKEPRRKIRKRESERVRVRRCKATGHP